LEQAEQQISARKTGDKTQQLQKQVISDLSQLISRIEKQQQSKQVTVRNKSSNKQQPKPDPNQQPQPEDKQPAKQPEDKDQPGSKPQNNADKSAQSTTEQRESKGSQPTAIKKEVLAKDVWGHLPPSLRRKLLNSYSDQYLPQYDELVRRYFESLAEENRSKK